VDSNNAKTGRLYGIGVGPGDPELITVKASKVLSRVPCIFVPQKNDKADSFALSIMENLLNNKGQEVIGLTLPMLKDIEKLEAHWEKAAAQIWERLASGQDCAFINVGDPLLYGTFIHILRTLQRLHPDVKVEVIPGISSVSAAAARSIVPLAINDERLAIVPADSDEKFIRATLEKFDTVAFMKVNTAFDRLLGILEDMKLTDKCVYMRRCSTQDEEIVRDMKQLKGKKLDYFSILLVRR
jgi:precorrin-2/cobalt-factor-2 C20-methyltransferase